MERLTCKFGEQNVLRGMCTFDRESETDPDDCMNCLEICEEHNGNCSSQDCPIQTAFNRLAAYEDTNLTPEQITEMDKLYAERCREVAEYKKLEEQGLLLKLPCKAGDLVWSIKTNEVALHEIVSIEITKNGVCFVSRYPFCKLDDFGKTVFLTQAEAEEALKGMEGKSK